MFCQKCNKEIAEGAKFCMYCGCNTDEVAKEHVDMQGLDADKLSGKKTNRILMYTFIVLILVIPVSIYWGYKNSPSVKLENSLKKGDLDNAITCFGEMDDKNRQEAKQKVIEYAEQMVENYINEQEEYEYAIVSASLQKLSMTILSSKDLQEELELVERINMSRTKYQAAIKYKQEGEIANAILAYKAVVSEDEKYYLEAQNQIPVLINTMREECMENVQECVRTEEYEEAKNILEEALCVIPKDSTLVSELEIVELKVKEKDIDNVIQIVKGYIVDKNYTYGFEQLQKAINKYPGDQTLKTELNNLKEIYKQDQLSKLDGYYAQNAFSEAILMLQEMQKYLPNDQDIQELLVAYESYLPIPLTQLEIYEERCVYSLNETLNDNFGNSYPRSMCLLAEESAWEGTPHTIGKAEYLINGKYNRISGNLAYWGDVYHTYRRGKSHLEIYSDNILVYTSEQITEDTKPIFFEAQLGADCHKLTIKLVPDNAFESYVILGDVQVYNR